MTVKVMVEATVEVEDHLWAVDTQALVSELDRRRRRADIPEVPPIALLQAVVERVRTEALYAPLRNDPNFREYVWQVLGETLDLG